MKKIELNKLLDFCNVYGGINADGVPIRLDIDDLIERDKKNRKNREANLINAMRDIPSGEYIFIHHSSFTMYAVFDCIDENNVVHVHTENGKYEYCLRDDGDGCPRFVYCGDIKEMKCTWISVKDREKIPDLIKRRNSGKEYDKED